MTELREDISKFFPVKLRNRQLFSKVESILQDMTDQELVILKDVVFKYKDPYSINAQAAKEVIAEYGFDYITEIVEALTEEEIGTIVSYMGLVHLLKGSSKGLEVVLDLLNFSYEVIDWWEVNKDVRKGTQETDPMLDVHEFKLVIDILNSPNFSNIFYTVPKIKKFSRNYVYPLLAYIELVFIAKMSPISATASGTMDTERIGEASEDFIKIVVMSGVKDKEYRYNVLFEDVEPSTFDNSILTQDGFFLYGQNADIIKLEM